MRIFSKRDEYLLGKGSVPAAGRQRGLSDVIEMVKAPESDLDSLEDVQAKLKQAREKLSELLPIEVDARTFVDAEVRRLLTLEISLKARQKFDGKYRTIPLDVLKWRDSRKLPILVPFSINDPRFVIESFIDFSKAPPSGRMFRFDEREAMMNTWTRNTRISPRLPTEIELCYEDVVDMIRAKRDSLCKASVTFGGVIPDDIRALIKDARNVFEQIFIIAEVEMDYIETKLPAGDPIVAGWDGSNLYYLADFDTTAVEEAALLEGPARIT